MYKLSNEDILHVSYLSKLNIDDIDKYIKDLEDILKSIDKINKLDIKGNVMISPSKNNNIFSDYSNNKETNILFNVKDKVGDFIKVEDMR